MPCALHAKACVTRPPLTDGPGQLMMDFLPLIGNYYNQRRQSSSSAMQGVSGRARLLLRRQAAGATRHPFVADAPGHRCHPRRWLRQSAAPANTFAGAAGCRVLLLLTVNWKSGLNRLHVATAWDQDRECPIALVRRRVGLVDSDRRQAG